MLPTAGSPCNKSKDPTSQITVRKYVPNAYNTDPFLKQEPKVTWQRDSALGSGWILNAAPESFVKSAFSKAGVGRASRSPIQGSRGLKSSVILDARDLPRLSLVSWQSLSPLLASHPDFSSATERAGISERHQRFRCQCNWKNFPRRKNVWQPKFRTGLGTPPSHLIFSLIVAKNLG